MLRRYAVGREFESRGGMTFYLFLFTSFSKSFFIVLLPLIYFNVNFRDYLYMSTIWILYFHTTYWSVWFSDLLLVTACTICARCCYHIVAGNDFQNAKAAYQKTKIGPKNTICTKTCMYSSVKILNILLNPKRCFIMLFNVIVNQRGHRLLIIVKVKVKVWTLAI